MKTFKVFIKEARTMGPGPVNRDMDAIDLKIALKSTLKTNKDEKTISMLETYFEKAKERNRLNIKIFKSAVDVMKSLGLDKKTAEDLADIAYTSVNSSSRK